MRNAVLSFAGVFHWRILADRVAGAKILINYVNARARAICRIEFEQKIAFEILFLRHAASMRIPNHALNT